MQKFTIHDALSARLENQMASRNHKDQHRNGMQAVEFAGKPSCKSISTPDLIKYQQDLQKPRPHGRHGPNLQPGTSTS